MYKFQPRGTDNLDVHYIVRQHTMDTFQANAPVMPYCAGFFDAVYDMDYRMRSGSGSDIPTTREDIQHFCENFRLLTTMESFTLVISCSFLQLESFREAMLETCFHVSRLFWIKPGNTASQSDIKRYGSNVEVFLIGYGKKGDPAQTTKSSSELSRSNSEVPEAWQHNWAFDAEARCPNGTQDERDMVADHNRRNYVVSQHVDTFAHFNGQVPNL
jgi:hypothetical protein